MKRIAAILILTIGLGEAAWAPDAPSGGDYYGFAETYRTLPIGSVHDTTTREFPRSSTAI